MKYDTTSVTLIDDDEEDEFDGLTVDMEAFKARCKPVDDSDEDDEFGGLTVDMEVFAARCKSNSTDKTQDTIDGRNLAQTVADVLNLPEGWDEIGFDSEYLSQTDNPTIPFCTSFHSAGNFAEYLHPQSHPALHSPVMVDVKRKMRLIAELQSLRVFKTPFVILDFLEDTYGIRWRPIKDFQRKRVHTLKMYFFFSFKDLQFLWAKNNDFMYYCLQYLERIRRITTKFNKPITLPYEVFLPCKKGMKWHCLSMELIDLSAMQGSKSLKTYLQNVGLPDDCKNVWDWDKDNNPLNFLIQKPREFIQYIRSDVRYLKRVYEKTIEFYNDIAATVGVKPSRKWGLSTGKITAKIVSKWIADRPNVNLPTCDNNEGSLKPLYWYNRLASPEAMKQLSHFVGNQALLYLGMTDGGRCVKERSTIDVLDGVLVDIDINGCYGNGLKNQIFPIGSPSILALPMKFDEWEKTYSKYLLPGLWVARISWKNAPFKQDLLLSKEEKAFTSWDWYQSHFSENNSDTSEIYDASMYLATNEVHMAAFNHDLFQVIKNYSSNDELAWVRENAVIECFAYYDKRDEVDKVTPEMCEMRSIKDLGTSGLIWNTKWVRIDLKELATALLERRTNHKNKLKIYNTYFGKENKDAVLKDIEDLVIDDYLLNKNDWLYQTSVQEFIKLIVNTIYGCVASSYFAGDETGISNFIVGNNITARARTLAWTMAKGLYTLMIITDGGVFDSNKVAFYERKSLNIFTELGFEKFKGSNGQTVINIKPLFGYEISQDETMFNILDKSNHVQNLAWKHLKSQFGELDIFKYDQFTFEVKKLYTKCEIRNKSDYRLFNRINGEFLTKIRGLSKKSCQDNDDIPDYIELTEQNINEYRGSADNIVKAIFDDISNQDNNIRQLRSTRLLGISEWRNMNSEKRKLLLPHDEISEIKKFYSFTPLGCKYINSSHHKDILRLYDQLRQWERPELMEQLRKLETISDEVQYKRLKKEIRAKSKSNN
jgi:hypothetical protein